MNPSHVATDNRSEAAQECPPNAHSPATDHADTFAQGGRIEVANVTLRRGAREILSNVSARFHCGEVGVILGPNGAGKSTLLRVISGVLRPDTGTVLLGKQPLHSIPAAELARLRAMLTQGTTLSAEFTVAEVVALGRTPHNGDHTRRAARASDTRVCTWALATVGLEEFAARRFSTLSGGEQQRVHLARVLAQLHDGSFPDAPTEPRADAAVPNGHAAIVPQAANDSGVRTQDAAPPAAASSVLSVHGEGVPPSPHPTRWLLLDEPTSALDLRHQHTVLTIARRLAHTANPPFGVIAVLHDLNLALRYADTTVLMHNGAIAAAGPTRKTLTCDLINTVYDVHSRLCETGSGCPFIQTEPR